MKNIEYYIDNFKKIIVTPEDVLICSGIFFEIYNNRSSISEAVKMHLHRLSLDPYYSPRLFSNDHFIFTAETFGSSSSGALLNFDLMIGIHAGGRAVATSNSSYCLCTPLNAALPVEIYNLPDDWDSSIYDPSVVIKKTGEKLVQPGEILEVVPGGDIVRFTPESPTTVLKLVSKAVDMFEWSFDLTTGLPWQSIATDLKLSQIAEACEGAKLLGDIEFTDALLAATFHKTHYIRWAAIQTLASLNQEAAINRLIELVEDPHPHIAMAARKTIEANQFMIKGAENGSYN